MIRRDSSFRCIYCERVYDSRVVCDCGNALFDEMTRLTVKR